MILRTTTIKGPGIIGRAPLEPTIFGLPLSKTPTEHLITAIRQENMDIGIGVTSRLEDIPRVELEEMVLRWSEQQQGYY